MKSSQSADSYYQLVPYCCGIYFGDICIAANGEATAIIEAFWADHKRLSREEFVRYLEAKPKLDDGAAVMLDMARRHDVGDTVTGWRLP